MIAVRRVITVLHQVVVIYGKGSVFRDRRDCKFAGTRSAAAPLGGPAVRWFKRPLILDLRLVQQQVWPLARSVSQSAAHTQNHHITQPHQCNIDRYSTREYFLSSPLATSARVGGDSCPRMRGRLYVGERLAGVLTLSVVLPVSLVGSATTRVVAIS